MATNIERLRFIKRKINEYFEEKNKYKTKYKVEGNIKGKKQMLYILSGYKPYLWDDVFGRIKEFQTDEMEVCIGSSGKYCEELSQICKKNDWVYVSTSLNNVCVITNVIMRLFNQAEYIFKLDEDIYLPEGYFTDMIAAYDRIEKESPGIIGYTCPVLPLGFYGMHDFLIENNCLDEYEEKFGKHYVGGRAANPVFKTPCGIDEFIWEKMGVFDECAKKYSERPFTYEACATRSGIAAILFKRAFWDEIGGLKNNHSIGVGDAGDEGQITAYCALQSKMMYCVNNILVGHFAFGGSEPAMLKFKEAHPEIFAFKQKEEK